MKVHLNLSLDEDIVITLRQMATSHYTTMSQMVTKLILDAEQEEEDEGTLYTGRIADNFLESFRDA